MDWKASFISYYGEEGFLAQNGRIIGSEKVDQDKMRLAESLDRYYRNTRYTGD